MDGERPAAALPLLREALAADPNETSALETLGSLHFQQNNAFEAVRWFDRAIESGVASYLAHFYRAILAGPVPGPVASEGSDGSGGHGKGEEVVRAEDLLRRASTRPLPSVRFEAPRHSFTFGRGSRRIRALRGTAVIGWLAIGTATWSALAFGAVYPWAWWPLAGLPIASPLACWVASSIVTTPIRGADR